MKLPPDNRNLFKGDPAAAKAVASRLSEKIGKAVHKVDLSTLVSKYITETEKNIDQLFEKAKQNDWILFFDEADALFGKRTGVKDAHDKYANQEVSYLLKKIEEHHGHVIISTNEPEDPPKR